MGTIKGPYSEEYPIGSEVRIASRSRLEDFQRTWKLHHPLEDRQLAFAGRSATVQDVAFYHGGDELYELEDVPGIWHESCLDPVED
jgi:hypothetical protein